MKKQNRKMVKNLKSAVKKAKATKKVRRPRYHGVTKIKKGQKICWLAREFRNGWKVALSLPDRDVWLTDLRFADRHEVERVFFSRIVFVYLKNSKQLPSQE